MILRWVSPSLQPAFATKKTCTSSDIPSTTTTTTLHNYPKKEKRRSQCVSKLLKESGFERVANILNCMMEDFLWLLQHFEMNVKLYMMQSLMLGSVWTLLHKREIRESLSSPFVLSPFLIGRLFLREPSWKYSAKLVGF